MVYFVIIEISVTFEIRFLAVYNIPEMSLLSIRPFCETSLHDLYYRLMLTIE